jgi:hypothetical protein
MKAMGGYVTSAAAALGVATAAARLGMPALIALVSLAALVLAVACWVTYWVLGSQDRTNRASQILLARQGIPAAAPVPEVSTANSRVLTRMLQLVTNRKTIGAR